MKKLLCAFAVVAFSMTAVAGVQADMIVSEDFSSNTIGVLVDTSEVAGATAVDYSGGNALFGAGADGDRRYIGTADTDYGVSTDFTASVDVTITAAGGVQGFFGFGAGVTDGVVANGGSFGEPSTGPAVLVGTENGFIRVESFAAGTTNQITLQGDRVAGVAPGPGTYTLGFDFDRAAGTLAVSLDGAVIATEGIAEGFDVAAFDATNSRVFIGGSRGAVFDNLSVVSVPEPTSLAIIGLGLVGTFVRRRRG